MQTLAVGVQKGLPVPREINSADAMPANASAREMKERMLDVERVRQPAGDSSEWTRRRPQVLYEMKEKERRKGRRKWSTVLKASVLVFEILSMPKIDKSHGPAQVSNGHPAVFVDRGPRCPDFCLLTIDATKHCRRTWSPHVPTPIQAS